MDVKKDASGDQSRQRRSKVHDNHNKKHATPSQVRANHEHQQKLTTTVANMGQANTRGKANSGQGIGDEGSRGRGGDAIKISVAINSSKNQKQLKSDRARVESAGESLDKNLEIYSQRAKEIKAQISAALDKQARFHEIKQSDQVNELRNTILELTKPHQEVSDSIENMGHTSSCVRADEQQVQGTVADTRQASSQLVDAAQSREEPGGKLAKKHGILEDKPLVAAKPTSSSHSNPANVVPPVSCADDHSPGLSNNCFEPLMARLDPKTKFIALKSSLEKHFVKCPELLDPICNKFILLTNRIDSLTMYNERNQMEIEKLSGIKSKLSDLCRELQRSNNQIRIESLDMIKAEQNKAKEQAGKIQSTLSGVMKLFDENQQRNLSLKQENIELQNKLKSILEHCDNWEKCVDTTLKQRELENRMIKTEMARISLLHNEDKQKFFNEKQELLKALAMMKVQQGKIEEKESKLRSDLTNYASKYDECQEIIHKGLSKFQLESKRMLKQIEKSRQDYIELLGKYEASNKKIKQLLEEKQTWAQSLGAASRKLETLERLCRTLKAENDKLQQQKQSAGNLVFDNKTSEPAIQHGQVVSVNLIAHSGQTLAPSDHCQSNGRVATVIQGETKVTPS